MATTASLPTSLTTESFTPPSWMYITCLAASPWAKIDSLRANLATFLPRPVESRNAFTSKTRLRELALFGGRETLIDTARLADDTIGKNSMGPIGESVQN